MKQKTFKETDSSQVYNKLRAYYTKKRSCFICLPNAGCNRYYSPRRHYDRSWKNFRKTQYKVR